MKEYTKHLSTSELTESDLDVLIATEWKSGKRIAYAIFLFSLFLAGIVLTPKFQSIPELNEMEVIEGILIDFSGGGARRSGPYITVRKDDGATLVARSHAANPYYASVKQLEGKRITVWLGESCPFYGYACSPSVNQLQYKDEVIIDYNNFVRINMERNRGWSIKGNILLFIPFLTFLIGLLALYLFKVKIKRMRSEFESRNIKV